MVIELQLYCFSISTFFFFLCRVAQMYSVVDSCLKVTQIKTASSSSSFLPPSAVGYVWLSIFGGILGG